MQNPDENINNLYSLPIPILLEIGARLSVKDASRLAITNRRFYQVFSDNAFWEHKFKFHYHSLYSTYKNQKVNDWYVKFKENYFAEKKNYKKLGRIKSQLVMQVIFAVRENDIEALKKLEKLPTSLDIFDLPDLNNWDILQTAKNRQYTDVLAYLWQLVSEYQSNESQRFKTINGVPNKVSLETHVNLLELAIGCQRASTEIMERLAFLESKKKYFSEPISKNSYQFHIAGNDICLLETAIKYQNQDVINCFLKKNNTQIESYHLNAAIYNGDMDNFLRLLSKIPGATKAKVVNGVDIYTPISQNNLRFVKLLIENGYKLYSKGKSPLSAAIKENADEIVQYLLSVDKNFKLKDYGVRANGVAALLDACVIAGNYRLFKELIEKDIKQNFFAHEAYREFLGSKIAFAAFKAKQFDFLNQFLKDSEINPTVDEVYAHGRKAIGFLDEFCEQKVLQEKEKETARILVDNGFKPYQKSPLQYFLNTRSIDPALLLIVYEQEIVKLQAYCAKRRADPREYYFSFFSKNFGFSSADKIKAAETLIKLLKGECQDLSELTPSQWAALHQGELGNIYREIRTTAQIRKEEYTKLRPGIKV